MHSEYIWYHDVFLVLTAVDCSTLSNPTNGQVSHTGRTIYRQTATYSCDTGYNLVGNSNRTCEATGVWSGSEPICQGMLLLNLEYYVMVLGMYAQNMSCTNQGFTYGANRLCRSTRRGYTVFL